MTVRIRKKNVQFRGSRTHGLGTKKGRGSGNRGGYGMAGSGKRADQKKPGLINLYGNDYFGKHGFVRQTTVYYKAINLDLLDKKIDGFVKKGEAENKAGLYTVDLGKLGIGKLLGNGETSRKMKITVERASKSAIEKVKKAGGELITKMLEAKKPKKKA